MSAHGATQRVSAAKCEGTCGGEDDVIRGGRKELGARTHTRGELEGENTNDIVSP